MLSTDMTAPTCETSSGETQKKIIKGNISGSLDNSLQCDISVLVMHHVFPTIIKITVAMA